MAKIVEIFALFVYNTVKINSSISYQDVAAATDWREETHRFPKPTETEAF